MSILFAYMAGGEGVGVRGLDGPGGQNFSTCSVCVCVCRGGQVQYLSFRKKNILLVIDWSL